MAKINASISGTPAQGFENLADPTASNGATQYIWDTVSLAWVKDTGALIGGNVIASENISQFGGTNVSTGTGVGGAGIPRVTVSSDSFPSTQTVSGTVTANQGGAPWTIKPDGTVWTLTGTSANVDVTNTVTVSGTVTTTPPANASSNVAQFGGVNISTGTGASGTGIPRVTVSNDSNVLATQSGTWTVQQGGSPWGVSGTVSVGNFPTTQTLASGTAIVGQVYESNASPLLPLLQAILTELRVTNYLLQSGLNVQDEPDTLRSDPFYNSSVIQ